MCAHLQEELEEEASVPLARMEFGGAGACYVALRHAAGALPQGKLATTLQFTVKEIDPASGAHAAQGSFPASACLSGPYLSSVEGLVPQHTFHQKPVAKCQRCMSMQQCLWAFACMSMYGCHSIPAWLSLRGP
jgi:hypothetical protein